MKKIGIIDYYVDEWHSNTYFDILTKLNEQSSEKYCFKYAYAELETFNGSKPTAKWCEEKGVENCQSIEEVCAKSDYLMILAPSNPEKHLAYATKSLPYGKPTFIDKTFATSQAEARKIFQIAEKYGTKIFSSSALRFATEYDKYLNRVKNLMVFGSGPNFEEYCIHLIEINVKLMGMGAKNVRIYSNNNHVVAKIYYNDDRTSFINFARSLMPFAINVDPNDDVDSYYAKIESDYFYNLVDAVIKFYGAGALPVSCEETLEVMGIRDAMLKGFNNTDELVEVTTIKK